MSLNRSKSANHIADLDRKLKHKPEVRPGVKLEINFTYRNQIFWSLKRDNNRHYKNFRIAIVEYDSAQSSRFAIFEALHAYRQSQTQFHYSSKIEILRQTYGNVPQ